MEIYIKYNKLTFWTNIYWREKDNWPLPAPHNMIQLNWIFKFSLIICTTQRSNKAERYEE